jgi:hypothetical protein
MVKLENDTLLVEIAPEVGARITRFVHKPSGYDYLWINESVPLRLEQYGTEYDPNFYGGIDELLPNDLPETIDGIPCFDHGELWTTPFEVANGRTLVGLTALLPKFEFEVRKILELEGNACVVKTQIYNRSESPKPFLWKLHAALKIQPGDRITCGAERYTAVDPEWSRRGDEGEWKGETIPNFDGSTEFLYLHPLTVGNMAWTNGKRSFEIRFSPETFPYCWYFASYGGFFDHEVAVLEPCTCMPKEVNAAANLGQCPVLEPGGCFTGVYRYVAR